MGDDDNNKAIPSWQRRDSTDSSDPPDLKEIEPRPEPDTPSESDASLGSREELVAQAATWLDHQHIRDAPLEGKVSFLEGKGLTQEEINKMLDVPSAAESDKTAGQSSAPATTSTSKTSSPDPQISYENATTNSATSRPASSNDAPPIITYPEFLLKPPSKPPLISRGAVLNTLYAGAVAAGALHLTSTHLVGPLLSELTTARHDLLANTTAKLDELNYKLSLVVSHVPAAALASHPKPPHLAGAADDDAASDTSSASDPTELFHRDIGVQTSRPGSPTSTDSTPSAGDSPGGVAEAQAAKLGRLRAQISGLIGATESATEAERDTVGAIDGLDRFLDGVRFGRSKAGLGSGLPEGVSVVGGDKNAGLSEAGGEDEVDRVKREIKAVKGVLLSARSFPSSVARANVVR